MSVEFQDAPIVVTHIGDGFKLAFRGPIHVNTRWLESELDKVVSAKPKVVEMDFADTEHISSFGLGVLLSFNRRIVANGGVSRIVKIRKLTLNVIRYAKLDKVLHIEPTAEIVGAEK